jgi:hypothetical protein
MWLSISLPDFFVLECVKESQVSSNDVDEGGYTGIRVQGGHHAQGATVGQAVGAALVFPQSRRFGQKLVSPGFRSALHGTGFGVV